MKTQEILDAVKSGKTAYFSSYTQIRKVDQKCVERFQKAGYSLMKDGPEGFILLRAGRSMLRWPEYAVTVQ